VADRERVAAGSSALVVTASDKAALGLREDASGAAIQALLEGIGFDVERRIVADDRATLESTIRGGAARHHLVVTTGGTGLTPRDVTPQATQAVIDYEIPGLAEAMRAAGRAKTPLADLSRSLAGVAGRTLVINVPGSPKAASESIEAILAVIPHALETLAGPWDHQLAETTASGSKAS
jgi:molybdenum cofactor synthesis domain-containing protein